MVTAEATKLHLASSAHMFMSSVVEETIRGGGQRQQVLSPQMTSIYYSLCSLLKFFFIQVKEWMHSIATSWRRKGFNIWPGEKSLLTTF